MKAFVTIALTIGFASISFAQTCGVLESEADTYNSFTWKALIGAFIERDPNPDHWQEQEADFYINESSCPSGGAAAIRSAAATWNAASWKGHNDFTFNSEGNTQKYADIKDGENVIAFQAIQSPGNRTIARTYVMARKLLPWPRDRLKEVDMALNVNKYWATAPKANHYDIESAALHEFGHWLVMEHAAGCDEYLPAVMYDHLNKSQIKRDLHWIDKWGKWYIYSSGYVAMAPVVLPNIPPPLTSATDVLHTRLLQNYPDPFNPETWIPYELADDSEVAITIYNSSGNTVRYINVGMQPKGRYIDKAKAVYWDGKNDNGENVASGMYFYTLQTENETATDKYGFAQTRRMVILK